MVDLTRIFPGGFKAPTKAASQQATDPFRDFEAELIRQGFDLPGPVVETEDRPIRCKVNGSKGKDGWYHFNLFRTRAGDDIGFGHFGDWRDAMTVSWSSRASQLDDTDRRQFDSQRREQAETAKIRRNELHNETAKQAANYIASCSVPISHSYLAKKKVKNYGLLERAGQLIVPLKNSTGEIRSYQTINARGEKLYLADAQKSGCFHLIGQVGTIAYIVEGYATGASVHEATGQGVFVALDTSNLAAVVKAARKLYPSIRLVIAADNDRLKTDAGRVAAEKAASGDAHCSVIVAHFDGDEGTDFNDLANMAGIEAVKAQLQPLGEVKRARSVPFSQLSRKPPEWVLKGVLPVNTLCVLFGPSGGGKSFLALDMAFHVALGESWNGHKVARSGGVYYICGEGDEGIGRRADAWETYHRRQLPGDDLHKTTSAVPLSDPEELQRVIDDINSKPGMRLVIIDTLNRNFGGGDENSTADMTAFVQACDRIRVECGVVVVIVHHTGLNATDRARGSSVLKAASDVEIMLAPMQDGSPGFTMIGVKTKDAENVKPMTFGLKTIVLGVDEDGEDYTSCVIEQGDGADGIQAAKMLKMGKNQTTVFSAAKTLTTSIRANLGPDSVAQFTSLQLFEVIDGMRMDRFKEALAALVDRDLLDFDAPHYSISVEI